MVSLTITGVLMVGISTFFASSFANLFTTQTQAANRERQFAVNEIVREKLSNLDSILNSIPAAPADIGRAVTYNQNNGDQLPFSLIRQDSLNSVHKLVFKDFILFNKISFENPNYNYVSTGEKAIRNAATGAQNTSIQDHHVSSYELLNGDYYVIAKERNDVTRPKGVYKCNNPSDCPPSERLDFDPELSSPTDITSDGVNTLYITDSEAGTVIPFKVGTGQLNPIATGLKYPTGVDFYDAGGTKYLFVADTLNNEVKRIQLNSPFTVKTVIGAGEDEDCITDPAYAGTQKYYGTAKYCQLSLPTGVFVDDFTDPNVHSLYISDSGNNRVLKIEDPEATANSILIDFTLDNPTKISKVEFEFPTGTTLSNVGVRENLGGIKGVTSESGEVVSLNLNVTMEQSYLLNQECPPAPAPCIDYFNMFAVLPANNIFTNGDEILISGDATQYNIDFIDDTTSPWHEIHIAEDTNRDIAFPPGTGVKIDKIFPAQAYQIELDLSDPGNLILPGFKNVKMKVYNEAGTEVHQEQLVLRIGDGELGTSEDLVKIIAENDGTNPSYVIDEAGVKTNLATDIIFPTGVSNLYFANSGSDTVVSRSGNEISQFDAVNENLFTNYDFISEFDLKSDAAIRFNTRNGGNLIEMEIDALIDTNDNFETYKLNAQVP